MLKRFTLTYNGVDTDVCEPRGWSDFESEIKRSFKAHGAVFRFTSGEITLGFPGDGRTVLENAFQLEGIDANVTFKAESRPNENASYTTDFEGRAVMQNRVLTRDYFECDFEEDNFKLKLNSRKKIKVRLDRTTDLDGNSLTGSIDARTGTWQSIRLNRIYDAQLSGAGDDVIVAENSFTGTTATSTTSGNIIRASHGYVAPRVESLNTVTIDGTEIEQNEASYASGDVRHLVEFEKGGNVNAKGSWVFDMRLNAVFTGAPLVVTLRTDVYLRVYNNDLSTQESSVLLQSFVDSNGGSPASPQTHEFTDEELTFDEDFTVNAGDKLFLVFESQCTTSTAVDITLDNRFRLYTNTATAAATDDTYVTITNLIDKENVGTITSWYIYDVIEWLIYIYTGQSASLSSTFFNNTDIGAGADGCGSLNVITNGYRLRGLNRPLTISLDQVLTWAQARYDVGWGFEKQGNGTYKVVVEPIEYFYTDNEIVDLGSPVDVKDGISYQETISDELTFNQVEIGYGKFSDEIGINNIFEDFLTEAQYSLPLASVSRDSTLSRMSPLIASNDLIQATYEARVELGKSWKYDEANFIVAVSSNGSAVIPENDENFESVDGLDDKGSAYNIRHAPVYMFLDNALTVNSALMGKDFSEMLINTSVEINVDFKATFSEYEDCLLGDVQRLQRSANGDIDIGNNFVGLRLFDPIEHEFKTVISKATLDSIIAAMEGNNADSTKNYGYLTYRDNEGNIQTGYPMSIKWNPNARIATVRTLEKADNYLIGQ